jgi:hypothetical protein
MQVVSRGVDGITVFTSAVSPAPSAALSNFAPAMFMVSHDDGRHELRCCLKLGRERWVTYLFVVSQCLGRPYCPSFADVSAKNEHRNCCVHPSSADVECAPVMRDNILPPYLIMRGGHFKYWWV